MTKVSSPNKEEIIIRGGGAGKYGEDLKTSEGREDSK